MTLKQKYLTQREWVDYCAQRAFYIKKVIKKCDFK
jgi:hypothetical protein